MAEKSGNEEHQGNRKETQSAHGSILPPFPRIHYDLAHVDTDGKFQAVTSNKLMIADTAAFVAWSATVNRNLQLYAGVPRPDALPGEPAPLERIVGVPLRSYGSVSLIYRFNSR